MIWRVVVSLGICMMGISAEAQSPLSSSTEVQALLAGVTSVDQIIKEFRSHLQNKLFDITTNFMPIREQTDILFLSSSSRDNSCPPPGRKFLNQPLVAKIGYQVHINDQKTEMTESLLYFGCRGVKTVQEDIRTTGENLKPIGLDSFFDGTANFDFQSNFRTRKISYTDEANQIIISFLSEREDEDETHKITFYGQDSLIFRLIKRPDYREVVFNVEDMRKSVLIIKSPAKLNLSGVPQLKIFERNDDYRAYEVAGVGNVPLIDFQSYFKSYIIGAPVTFAKEILRGIVKDFPATSFSGGQSGQSQQIVDDLTLAKIRVQSGESLDLVRQTLQEILDGIAAGTIVVVDRRAQ